MFDVASRAIQLILILKNLVLNLVVRGEGSYSLQPYSSRFTVGCTKFSTVAPTKF
eukprot:SAG31_NODE_855_length_11461_cov_5.496215_14_plen_55_part_00